MPRTDRGGDKIAEQQPVPCAKMGSEPRMLKIDQNRMKRAVQNGSNMFPRFQYAHFWCSN